MDGLLILFIVVLLSLLVTRVAAVALTLTGLSRDVAQFQARSALSSTGLGTREAEQIMGHPARRQIYLTLMLIGNAGLVTGIASLSRSFNVIEGGDTVSALALVIFGLVVLLVLARNKRVATGISKIAELVLRRYTDLDVGDYAGLLHVGMNYGVNRVKVEEGHWMAGQTLADSRLTDEGMLVLGVERPNGVYLGAPRGDTAVEPGNSLLVYGPTGPVEELHNRPAGEEGDRLHQESVEASRTREAAERSRDRKSRGWRSRRRRARSRPAVPLDEASLNPVLPWPDFAGTDRSGSDRSGPDQSGPDQSDRDRTGPDPAGAGVGEAGVGEAGVGDDALGEAGAGEAGVGDAGANEQC